ncbi:hypothetical protein ACQKP0_04335 [Heyndrickxia sp. NPDC080065]|uniref:hypothetical protein n=1 Tax=Heyndrickxia sp. NPDC080065 TaxID=3390568 RepID=UPI003CFBE6B9
MKRILTVLIVLILVLVGCSNEINSVNKNNKTPNKENNSQVSTNQKNNTNQTNSNSNDSDANSKPPLRKDGKWVQLGHRLYYIQGTVKSLQKNKSGKEVLNLLVEKTFQSEADGVTSPYKAGKVYSFLLNDLPKVKLKQKKIIIYGGQVTSNDQDNFIGARVVYYQLKNKFVDLHGNAATLPPKEYPYQF